MHLTKEASSKNLHFQCQKLKYIVAAGTALVLGGTSYLVWKYALGSPTSVSAARAGLDDFKTVLKDGLDRLDFGRLFDNDPKEDDLNVHVWRRNFIQPGNGDFI